MNARTIRLSLLGLALGMLAACSTTNDSFVNRTYHRLTARDNGWFNANEKLNESVAAMEKAYVDDYDEVLPIFIYGTDEQSKALVPDMEKCIEKCGTVIERHSMDIGNKEENTWIDDAYFVIGRANFYKRSYFDAERTFDYISRKFKGQNRQLESKLWLARTAIQMEQYPKAQSALDEVKNQKLLPKHFPQDQLSAVQADLDLKRGKLDDAIVDLEHAVDITKNRKQRVRWEFILAQLYQTKGMQEKAIATYTRVAHSNPPYELGFHAQIFQALAFDQGDSKSLRTKLMRMRRDEKNKDHFDVIEYAFADLDLKENKDSSAIAHLKESARVSTTDQRQKAKSFLKLADLFFDDKKYPSAQQYYDSTAALIPETHKRYDEVKVRADVLGELVQQLTTIDREDSLQRLAQMDPDEREKKIKRLIKEREREEEEKAALEAEAREVKANAPPTPDKTQQNGGDANSWYFYNTTTLARGLAEFKKKWGNRPNEDDWRRKDKSGSALAIEEPEPADSTDEQGTTSETKDGEPAWKDPANYMKDLPLDSNAMNASNARICEAMYIAGTIYKEKLKDIDNAIESFEVLNHRFEDCTYTPEAYYQLYRIYLAKEKGSFFSPDEKGSAYYAQVIQERWPDSELARLVRDPNQLLADDQHKAQEDSAYADLYKHFREGLYELVIGSCNAVLTGQPKNHLLPKYALLKALAVGGMRQEDAFRSALSEVSAKFPGTDEAKSAADMLAQLDKQANGGGNGSAPAEVVAAPQYSTADGPQYVVLIFPVADGDVNGVKTKISNFDMANFRQASILVGATLMDANYQVIKMGTFPNKQKAMEYYGLFTANKTDLAGVNNQGYATFAISAANYATFYKSKDVDAYASFFTKNYLQGQ